MSRSISISDFSSYPPLAQQFAADHIVILRSLPPVFCALLLNEISQYDWQFPAEREALAAQLRWIATADQARVGSVLAPFANLNVSSDVMDMPWPTQPALFLERLTADLWLTHSISAFYEAGRKYGDVLARIRDEEDSSSSRLCIVFIGSGCERGRQPLFEKLRPHGTYFSHIDMSNAVSDALARIEHEAVAHPGSYQHWYVDGGKSGLQAADGSDSTTRISSLSYSNLDPVRRKVIEAISTVRTSGVGGPEHLRTVLREMRAREDTKGGNQDEMMREFVLRLFTEGSGTQVFSTTFVQWTGREILRRARPQSLLLRFRLRQKERPMDELLGTDQSESGYDPIGSLADGDMGAYYTWINLQRLPWAANSRFVVCFEDGREALAIAPGLPKGASSGNVGTFKDLLRWIA